MATAQWGNGSPVGCVPIGSGSNPLSLTMRGRLKVGQMALNHLDAGSTPAPSTKWTNEYRREYDKARHQKTKTERQERNKAHRKLLRAIADEWKNAYPCADCGRDFPSFVKDFDHRKGSKLFNIADIVKRGVSIEKLVEEILKCDVVCANCHRIRTHQGMA